MTTIKTKDGIEIYYKEWGSGQPIVISHGWPLSADDWDAQMLFFLNHGYRVIAHDRRGRSTQTGAGKRRHQRGLDRSSFRRSPAGPNPESRDSRFTLARAPE